MFRRSKYRAIGWIFCLLSIVVLSGGVSAQSDNRPEPVGLRGDAPTYAVSGPYWIGARDNIEVSIGERPLVGTIWYPALNPDNAEYNMPYSSQSEDLVGPKWNTLFGQALPDAAPDTTGAPYPLIVVSHGWGLSRATTSYLMEHLASYGFVVMAVDHPGGTFRDQIMLGYGTPELKAHIPTSFVQWVLDDMRVIEYAAELSAGEGDFSGLIDTERIGAAGYSSGGITALQLAGAQYNLAMSHEFCADNPNPPPPCTLSAIEAELTQLAGVDPATGEMWSVVKEPVVDAVVALAPGSIIPFGAQGLVAVDTPTLVISGSLDNSVPPALVQLTYNSISSETKSLVWLENAGHYVFMDCDWQTDDYPMTCADRVWDRNRAYDLVNHFATALFLSALYDDEDARAALQSSSVDIPGIGYQTTIDG